MSPKHYVVEHCEPEIGAWSALEYVAIASETTPPNTFTLSSVDPTLVANIPASLTHLNITTKEVNTLDGIVPERVCLLDPSAEQEMTPEDAELFDWYVFGGILGDDPPRDRTAELRKYGFTGRRLGPIQMTTDTAVRVTRIIIEEQIPLEKIPYADKPEFRFNKNESIEMPFRYVKREDGTPIIPEGMLALMKKDADKDLTEMF